MSASSETTVRKAHSEDLLRPNREEPPRPERVCPTCGAFLIERKCKLLCPDPACGYYMSCSDFYWAVLVIRVYIESDIGDESSLEHPAVLIFPPSRVGL